MEVGAIGWIALGWFAVALVISLALGAFLRKVNETPGEEDLAEAASRQEVLRFMRGRKSAVGRGDKAVARIIQDQGKRATG